MARKWKITAAVWAAIPLYFIMGSRCQADADLFLNVLRWVLLAASTVYAVAVMIRERCYFSGYPPRFMGFALDEGEPKGARGGELRHQRNASNRGCQALMQEISRFYGHIPHRALALVLE